jgi:hypothetical protein
MRLITVSFLVDTFKRKGFIIIGSLLLLGSWMYQKFGYERYDSRSKLISADNERLIQALQAEQFTDFSIYMIRTHPNDSAYNRYRSNYFYTLLHRFLLVEYYCNLLMTEGQHFGILRNSFAREEINSFQTYTDNAKHADNLFNNNDSVGMSTMVNQLVKKQKRNHVVAQQKFNEMNGFYQKKAEKYESCAFWCFVFGSLFVFLGKIQQYLEEYNEKRIAITVPSRIQNVPNPKKRKK